ncbi:MAG: DUF222 domain-containing protein [Actinobacteria bacterium]|nr:DUF222 domain-containing protein [Actinomycetota bacterium]
MESRAEVADVAPDRVVDDPVLVDFVDGLTPAELLGMLAGMRPSALVLDALMTIDRVALSDVDAVAFLQVHQRVAAWWAAVGLEAIIPAAAAEPLIEEFTLLVPGSEEERRIRIADVRREELGAALRLPAATAQDRIDTARLLAGPLAATAAALAAGAVTDRHVAVIVEAAGRLPGRGMRDDTERAAFTTACADLERRVLPTAARATVPMTRGAARRAVLAIDAAGERRRRREARCTRDVYVVDELDGISTLIARMSTEAAHAVLAEVVALAHDDRFTPPTEGHAPATTGERRVEALAALVLGARGEGGATGDGGGRDGSGAVPAPRVRAHLDLVIDLPTLLDLAEGVTGGVVELRGSGPVSADVVRDLLADPEVAVTMRRLVTDPVTGHLLDYGRRVYQVPQRLREYVIARDRVCRFPGCRRAAARSQIDHAHAWNDGGDTSPANLGALCLRHHQLKTHTGWRITDSRPDGSCTWTSPHGRQYDHPAEAILRDVVDPNPPPVGD